MHVEERMATRRRGVGSGASMVVARGIPCMGVRIACGWHRKSSLSWPRSKDMH